MTRVSIELLEFQSKSKNASVGYGHSPGRSPAQDQFDNIPSSVEEPQAVNLTRQSSVNIEPVNSIWSASSSKFDIDFKTKKDTDEPITRRASASDIPIHDQSVKHCHSNSPLGGFVKPRSNSMPWSWPRASDSPITEGEGSAEYQVKEDGVWGPLDSTSRAQLPKQRFGYHDNQDKTNPQCVPFPNNIACILDNAGVPNLLFSSYSLGGQVKELLPEEQPTQGAGTDFVILDSFMNSAIEALKEYGFEPCRNKNCKYFTIARRQRTARVHFDRDPADNHGPIALYLKSRMLWWIEDWTVDRPSNCDPHLSLSNWFNYPVWEKDHSVPASNHPERYPAKILEVGALIQATMFLYCRDYNELDGRQNWWKPMLLALMEIPGEQIHPDGRTDIIPVGPVCRPYWLDFIDPETDNAWDAPYWGALLGLREYLIGLDYLVEPLDLCTTGP